MSNDHGRCSDHIGVGAAAALLDRGSHRGLIRIDEFDGDAERWLQARGIRDPALHHYDRFRIRPLRVIERESNLVTDAGWNLLMKNAAGTAGTLFSATVGRIGLGITAASPAYADTDLAAATGAANRQWKLISATPTVGTTHTTGLAFAATFSTAMANFHAQEWGTDQGTADATTASTAVFFNHGASDLGTKTAAVSWAVTITITWT